MSKPLAQKPRVRLHWVSPLPPAETDIAQYTLRVLPDLLQHADVVLWTDQESWDPSLESLCPVRRFDPNAILPFSMRDLPRNAATLDLLVFQVGNSWVFHSGVVKAAQSVPALVVLHDALLLEMMREAFQNDRLDRAKCLSVIRSAYAVEHYERLDEILHGEGLVSSDYTNFPLIEPALSNAIGVVAHTDACAEMVASRMPELGKVDLLPLPFAISPERVVERPGDGPLRLLQFGYFGPNRRLREVLDVLASLRGEIDFRFDVCGRIWDADAVALQIADLGLQRHVKLHGYVEEPMLEALLDQADAVFNLRYPTMGEASGSQLRLMNAGALSIVTDIGWYGALPDGVALKVPVEREARALSLILRRLARDRPLSARIGEAARSYVSAVHGTSDYAREFVRIAEHACARGHIMLRRAAARHRVGQAGQRDLGQP